MKTTLVICALLTSFVVGFLFATLHGMSIPSEYSRAGVAAFFGSTVVMAFVIMLLLNDNHPKVLQNNSQ